MKTVSNGMTQSEFLIVINQNFTELALARGVVPFDEITDSDNYVEKINTYIGETVINYGNKGDVIADSLSTKLVTEGLLFDPSLSDLGWAEECLGINFTDNNFVKKQHEIYESVNGGDYELIATTDSGVNNYLYRTHQNVSIKIKIRAKEGSVFSDYSSEKSYSSPWVIKCTQAGELIQLVIQKVRMSASDKKIYINWGDGQTTEFSGTVISEVTHDYSLLGIYWIVITGDLQYITLFELFSQPTILAGTKVDKWNLPSGSSFFAHFYANYFVGDLTRLYSTLPSGVTGVHFGSNYITCDMSKVILPDNYWDVHFASSYTDAEGLGIYGDVSELVLPERVAHFNINGYAYGDLTSVIPWIDTTYGTILLNLISSHPIGFIGDLSGWSIPDKSAVLSARIGCHFTKLPRGHFAKVNMYDFTYNSCSSQELDDILTYIDNYFTEGVVPEVGCEYRLSGTGMGVPSATGLAARVSIISKYEAQELDIEIQVNTS